MGNSFKGILVGFILLLISFLVLWFNEKNSAETIAGLKELQKAAVTVDSGSVNPEFEGKPVHVAGRAETDEVLKDPEFGVTANAIKLIREVEMFQWEEKRTTETQKKLGGGEETVTTFTYNQVWSAEPIDSSQFHQEAIAGHQNPPMPYRSTTQQAQEVALGAFRLSSFLVDQMDANQLFFLDSEQRSRLPAELRSAFQDDGPGYYRGEVANPQIGDLRVRFQTVDQGPVSIIAQQFGDTFEKYHARNGKAFGLLVLGERSKENVIHVARERNKVLTWILRFVGWLVMLIGLSAILRPLSVMADVLPFVGNLVGVGTGFVAALLATGFSLMVIAVAWMFYRPLISIPLALVATVPIVFAVMKMGKRKEKASA